MNAPRKTLRVSVLKLVRYLPYRYRHKLIQLLGTAIAPDSLSGVSRQREIFGARIALNLSDHIQFWMYVDGLYDKPYLTLIDQLLELFDVRLVVDVGANIGNHTFVFAQRGRSVHSFEPNPVAAAWLTAAVAQLKLTSVQIHNVGLADENEVAYLEEMQPHNLGSASIVSSSRVRGKPVQIVQADRYLGENVDGKIDFVKIDVEGAEVRVLRGMKKTIASDRPLICMEYRHETRGILGSSRALQELLPDYVPIALALMPEGVGRYFLPCYVGAVNFDPSKEYNQTLFVPRELACRKQFEGRRVLSGQLEDFFDVLEQAARQADAGL